MGFIMGREMIRAFSSRWDKVMLNGFRAIEDAVKSGYANATTQAKKEKEMLGLPEPHPRVAPTKRLGRRDLLLSGLVHKSKSSPISSTTLSLSLYWNQPAVGGWWHLLRAGAGRLAVIRL